MRDISWGGVQPIMVRGGVQPTITTTTITTITTTTRSRWHGGVGKLNFQPYRQGRSGTGDKETHSINIVGMKMRYSGLGAASWAALAGAALVAVGWPARRRQEDLLSLAFAQSDETFSGADD